MNDDHVQAVADELLQHDVSDGAPHTCLCGESVWVNGNGTGGISMARHRAQEIVRVLNAMLLQESVQAAVEA